VQAQGSLLEWEAIPEEFRRALTARLGSEVVRAENQPGGFSPGVAGAVRARRRALVDVVEPIHSLAVVGDLSTADLVVVHRFAQVERELFARPDPVDALTRWHSASAWPRLSPT
jgi:hypothetical protein